MSKSRLFDQVEKIFNTNLIFLLILGVIVSLTKIFDLISPFVAEVTYIPLIDLLVVTFGIIAAKYFFTSRSKINRSITLENKFQLYVRYTLFIIVILDIIYAVNLIVFLFTMTWIYLLVAGLIILLYVIYKPNRSKFNDDLLSEDEKNQFD